MKQRSLLARAVAPVAKLACAFLMAVFMHPAISVAQEEPSAAAVRFYNEYMSMGVALRPLGDRWFTIQFRGVMNAWDSDPTQKPIEGNPILPWKNWDSSWRNKLKD
jgi:hypothetical protein